MLSERGGVSGYPTITPASFEKRARVSDLTLKHELDILEVKTALTLAVRESPHLRLVEFSTWPALFEFQSAPGPHVITRTVRPDGFIRIRKQQTDLGVDEDISSQWTSGNGCQRVGGGCRPAASATPRIASRMAMPTSSPLIAPANSPCKAPANGRQLRQSNAWRPKMPRAITSSGNIRTKADA